MGNDKLNGSDWKKKWRNQRDLYIKKRRELRTKKSGQAAKKAMKWQFFETMNFLDKYTEETSTDTNVPAAVDDENESADELSDMEESQNTYVRSETQSRSASPSISAGQPCSSTEQTSTSSEKTGKQGTGLQRPLSSSGISRDNDAVSNMSKSLNQLIEVHKRHTEDWFKDTNKKTSEELFFKVAPLGCQNYHPKRNHISCSKFRN